MQHVEEAAHLRHVRSVLVRAPHVKLLQLGRIDERIAAHLDGVAVAGAYGVELAQQALEDCGKGPVFVATVRAIEDHSTERLYKLLAIAEAALPARPGLLSAFAWVSAAHLKGLVKPLLESKNAWHQEVGLAACVLHGVDPGSPLQMALHHADGGLRLRALRAAGELGRLDLLPTCLEAVRDASSVKQFAAAQASLLLGDRRAAPHAMTVLATKAGDQQLSALSWVLQTLAPDAARALIRQLVSAGTPLRITIQASAWAGDAQTVPWLLKQMGDDPQARVAGEAFSLITGADLALLDLERKPPEDAPGGPDEDPEDNNVALDEDESLPWPDWAKVQAWWQSNQSRFAAGTRYFVGAPPSASHCVTVLKTGTQRQRFLAARYLCLLQSGTPLFNCAAPKWRQQRALAGMP